MRNRNFSRFLPLLAILAVAFALRVSTLGLQELRGDEAFGYFFSQQSYSQIVTETLRLGEPHPVASYFLQKLWSGIAGDSEFALRFVSAWFGTLAVALLYRLGRSLALPRSAAALAALLLAISPYAVWHSQDARMYSMSLALTIASMWLLVEGLQKERWTLWVAYGAVSLLALYTHYFAAFVLAAQGVFVVGMMIAAPRKRAACLRWLVAVAAIALLYLPWLVFARSILSGYKGAGDSPGIVAMVVRSLSALTVAVSVPSSQHVAMALLAIVLVAVGAVTLARRSSASPSEPWSPRWTLALLLLYLLLPLAASWISALRRPIFDERYLITASAPFLLLVAAGLSGDPARTTRRLTPGGVARLAMLALLLAAMLLSLQNYLTNPAYSKSRGWRDLAVALDRLAQGMPAAQVRLVQNYPDPTLWYYYRGPVAHTVLPPAPQDSTGAGSEVERMLAEGVSRVVLVEQPSPAWDDDGIAASALAQDFTALAQVDVGQWPLTVYGRAEPAALTPASIAFANGLGVTGYLVEPAGGRESITPGGVVVVHLGWQGPPEALASPTKVFLHLTNEAGQPIAQRDQLLTAADLSAPVTSYAIVLPDSIAPGSYRLLVGLYNPDAPGASRVQTSDGLDAVLLAEVEASRP